MVKEIIHYQPEGTKTVHDTVTGKLLDHEQTDAFNKGSFERKSAFNCEAGKCMIKAFQRDDQLFIQCHPPQFADFGAAANQQEKCAQTHAAIAESL